jgi:hypothetical protein
VGNGMVMLPDSGGAVGVVSGRRAGQEDNTGQEEEGNQEPDTMRKCELEDESDHVLGDPSKARCLKITLPPPHT